MRLNPETANEDLERFRRRENRKTEETITDIPVAGAITYFWTMGDSLGRFPEFDGLCGSRLAQALSDSQLIHTGLPQLRWTVRRALPPDSAARLTADASSVYINPLNRPPKFGSSFMAERGPQPPCFAATQKPPTWLPSPPCCTPGFAPSGCSSRSRLPSRLRG